MKLTVLTDDNIFQGKNLFAEHGLSFYIEADGKNILFDAGYSDVFIKNASKMGINLLDLDYIVLSHGHYDHTWGLSHYLTFHTSAIKQGQKPKKPTILTHPNTFNEKFEEGLGEIGCMLSIEKLKKNFDIKLSKEPFWITENLVFLGEIPRENDFEGKEPICKVYKNNQYEDDYITEDSALMYKSDKGLAIITGCSHSGICNIADYATTICQQKSISAIIGGLHLINPSAERMTKTIDYFLKLKLREFYPSHCTSFEAKLTLSKHLALNEAGVGLILQL